MKKVIAILCLEAGKFLHIHFSLAKTDRSFAISAVFQAGGLVVVLVEVVRKAYLASIVPVIVNAVLNEHQVIVDIIAFVSKGDFPRSRLGEKQRGKILASWVTRKMRTIAQFGIRDADSADSQITEVAEPRSRVGSVVGKGSSLRNVETISGAGGAFHGDMHTLDYSTLPAGISEMPAAEYESSIVESPPIPMDEDRDETPTEIHNDHFPMGPYEHHYPHQKPPNSPPEPNPSSYPPPQQMDSPPIESPPANPPPSDFDFTPSDFDFTPSAPPAPRYDSKPILSAAGRDTLPSQIRLQQQQKQQQHPPPVPPLPTSSNHYSPVHDPGAGADVGRAVSGGVGKLRITNADSDDEGEWPREAIMHMNLAGGSAGAGTGGGGSERRNDAGGKSRADGGRGAWNGYDERGYGNAI